MTDAATPPFTRFELRTKRLTLRFIDTGDVPAVFAIFADPVVMRFWATPPWTTLAQAQDSVANSLHDYQSGSVLRLGITLGAQVTLIGTCTLFRIDRGNRRGEIGYALAREHWGHGYMHEALQAFLAYALATFDLHRIEADVDPRNVASARTLERQGFQREGLLRERWIVGGEVCDTALYGLLARDFKRPLQATPP
ncbi:MAG: GNAT family protein [Casimicrobiaceae bacterium]